MASFSLRVQALQVVRRLLTWLGAVKIAQLSVFRSAIQLLRWWALILPGFRRHPGLDAQEGAPISATSSSAAWAARPEAPAQIAIRAALLPAPVGQLMQRRCVVALAAAELIRQRKGHGHAYRQGQRDDPLLCSGVDRCNGEIPLSRHAERFSGREVGLQICRALTLHGLMGPEPSDT